PHRRGRRIGHSRDRAHGSLLHRLIPRPCEIARPRRAQPDSPETPVPTRDVANRRYAASRRTAALASPEKLASALRAGHSDRAVFK
ncbi:MAG: hypothetical protein K2X93_02630, partial [Candidatus Obscuribacterales bacterium]|nr:hypothetical protein [Candidatus Obscuribacterales bacterium]